VIAINLLPGAKRRRKGAGFKFALPNLEALKGLGKDPWLVACLVAWFLVLAVDLPLFLRGKSKWEAVQARYAAAQTQQTRYNQLIARRTQFERARDSLVVELDVIRAVDRDRYIWPHIMAEISRALPDYTWIDRVAARSGDTDSSGAPSFTVEGYTVDLQGFTRFLRNLEASPFVQNVEAGPTTSVLLEGREVNRYQLSARYSQPDTTRLTMQPLAATLVQGVRSGGGGRR